MTTPLTQFESWIKVLEYYAHSLAEYVAAIDSIARKSRPVAYATYRQSLEDASSLAADGVTFPEGEGVILATKAFEVFAKLEAIRESLDKGAAVALDPGLFVEATHGMSRTYVEDINTKARAIRQARSSASTTTLAQKANLAAMWAKAVAVGDPQEVSQAYASSTKTAAGAALFADSLVEWGRNKISTQDFAEGAKDITLGILTDGPSAVAADLAARQSMHPLQAMGGMFNLSRGGNADGRGAVTIDCTLPQSSTAVWYDINPLVDMKEAVKFGSLANIYTGLNYSLVRRLQTITETSIPPGDRAPAAITPGVGTAVVRTIDGGNTFQTAEGALPPEAYASVGAGPRPRTIRLGEILEEAVFGPGGGSRTIRDPENLLKTYGSRIDTHGPQIPLDELGQILIKRFSAVYDGANPNTAETFRAAVLGEGESRDMFRSYIAQSISEVSKRVTEQRLVRGEASNSTGPALLFGNRFLAAKGGRQEGLLTNLVHLRQSIFAATGHIAQAYDRAGADAQARHLYIVARGHNAAHTASHAREALGSRRRAEALALYRSIVEDAFYSHRRPRAGKAARVVEKLGAVEPRPSLKLYVMERGDTS